MCRFKASRERKAEYIAQMEKCRRDDYRRRTGKEAESFCGIVMFSPKPSIG